MKPGILIALIGAALLGGCGESGRQEEQIQGRGLRQYDKNVLARGERVFQANCATCHGAAGEALPTWRVRGADGMLPPPPLDDSGHAWHHRRAWLKQMIAQGSAPGEGNMPAWGQKLSEQEIDDVVTWITSLWSDQIYLEWRTKIEQAAK